MRNITLYTMTSTYVQYKGRNSTTQQSGDEEFPMSLTFWQDQVKFNKGEYIMWTIIDRLKEPSTYAGLSAIMIAFGVSSEQWTTISTALASVAAVVSMLLKEKKD